MAFVQNFPFFCIILSMFSAIISFVMNGRVAKYIHVAMVTAVLILSLATLSFVVGTGESYTFMMGHFPAPWGNEIRIGELEALMAVFFSLIMMLSVSAAWPILTEKYRIPRRTFSTFFWIF